MTGGLYIPQPRMLTPDNLASPTLYYSVTVLIPCRMPLPDEAEHASTSHQAQKPWTHTQEVHCQNLTHENLPLEGALTNLSRS
jgi:hypothetical protein